MPIERTTLAAEADDLETLREEARRRRISLAVLLREVAAREAQSIRSARKPRVGVGRSGSGAAAAAEAFPDEPFEAAPYRS